MGLKLGNLHLFILKLLERCESYSIHLLQWLESHLPSWLVEMMRKSSRKLTSLQIHADRLAVQVVNSKVNFEYIGIAGFGFAAIPFLFFAYLLFPYGGIGSDHVDFAATVTIPLFNKTLDNPFRQYVNWYWLTKIFGYHIASISFGGLAFYGLKKRYKILAVWFIFIVTGMAINEVYAPHGKYEFTNVLFAALFAIGVYQFNRSKIRAFLSQILNK